MQWRWEYIFLILAHTFVTFEAARRIDSDPDPGRRKLWLWIAIVFSFASLGYFKYAAFIATNITSAFPAVFSDQPFWSNIVLPVGISFFTFQALSYVIDVYRGDHPAERSLTRYTLFVTFFPQLVAGPIERATHLLDQFKRTNRFDLERTIDGGKLILWGVFKKAVIADRLAVYVDRVYAAPDLWSGSTLLLATFFFAFQVYCDFSGYSDIAIGSARILGYDLMQNFRLPYLARSITDFWTRWHISLTSWFRSYLYMALGGNRVPYPRWLLNIAIVFLLSGLWHGAAWTFVAWGALHALFYAGESLGRRAGLFAFFSRLLPSPVTHVCGIVITFALVLISYVLFRANSLADAGLILSRVAQDFDGPLYMGPSAVTTVLSLLLIGGLMAVEVLQERGYVGVYTSRRRLPRWVRWPGYIGVIFAISVLGLSGTAFIYFQF